MGGICKIGRHLKQWGTLNRRKAFLLNQNIQDAKSFTNYKYEIKSDKHGEQRKVDSRA